MNKEIINLPKVELHLHFDGSVSIDLLKKWSGLSRDEVVKKAVSENDASLEEYLEHFNFINKYLQTKENLELASYTLGCDLEKENVIYAEVRFAPLLHTSEGLTGEKVIDSLLKGFSRCNIKINLILCMIRGMDYSYNRKTLDLAKKYLGRGVVAVDLAGDEKNHPFKECEELFKICKEEGIPTTIHAGEVLKRDIKDIIPYTKRIGHGIKIYNDLELINLVKENDMLLEVCPKSNVDTNNVSDYKHHHIKELYKMGVVLSVNTDNRTVSNVTLTDEYINLMNVLGFTLDDLYQMNVNAINYAYLSEEEKEKLINKLKEKKESQV